MWSVEYLQFSANDVCRSILNLKWFCTLKHYLPTEHFNAPNSTEMEFAASVQFYQHTERKNENVIHIAIETHTHMHAYSAPTTIEEETVWSTSGNVFKQILNSICCIVRFGWFTVSFGPLCCVRYLSFGGESMLCSQRTQNTKQLLTSCARSHLFSVCMVRFVFLFNLSSCCTWIWCWTWAQSL